MKNNTENEEQIKQLTIELFESNKTLTEIKNQLEKVHNRTIEFNTIARIIRRHLGARHRLFVRK